MGNMKSEHELVYDWNTVDWESQAIRPIEFDDETLRDGLQSPSITDPTIEEKIEDLTGTAEKMHNVFSKFNEQMARMITFLEALKSKEEELKQREARIVEYERRMR